MQSRNQAALAYRGRAPEKESGGESFLSVCSVELVVTGAVDAATMVDTVL